jgi:hypothetical protein
VLQTILTHTKMSVLDFVFVGIVLVIVLVLLLLLPVLLLSSFLLSIANMTALII